jgi:hypothetical protein
MYPEIDGNSITKALANTRLDRGGEGFAGYESCEQDVRKYFEFAGEAARIKVLVFYPLKLRK